MLTDRDRKYHSTPEGESNEQGGGTTLCQASANLYKEGGLIVTSQPCFLLVSCLLQDRKTHTYSAADANELHVAWL